MAGSAFKKRSHADRLVAAAAGNSFAHPTVGEPCNQGLQSGGRRAKRIPGAAPHESIFDFARGSSSYDTDMRSGGTMSEQVLQDGKIFVGRSIKPEYLELRLANRHGLITGATGTGKTVTLQVLAEGFSAAGVPVFAADIKGDLSGIAAVGEPKDFLVKRAGEVGLGDAYKNRAYPTIFWDVFGEQGHPIRATVQDMGPLLLSRLLELNEVQEGVLNIAFEWRRMRRCRWSI